MSNVRAPLDRARDRRSFFTRALGARADGGVRANREGCVSCHACVRACPRRALGFILADGWGRKLWRQESCRQCRQCVNICPDHLLEFLSRPAFEAGVGPARELTRFQFKAGPGCGALIRQTEGEICLTCRRRGGRP